MQPKITLKAQAIELRRQGHTYSEILQKVPVAKSTLSLWLHEVGMARYQVQRITEKRIQAALRGAHSKRQKRISRCEEIYKEAALEIPNITKRDLWFIGIALYWGEGSKEKDYKPGTMLQFSNSDGLMINLFIKWLKDILNVDKSQLSFSLFIHENCIPRLEEVKEYWASHTNFPKEEFSTIYFKKHIIKTRRKNTGEQYFGVLRVNVKASSALLRKVSGWIKRITSYKDWEIV